MVILAIDTSCDETSVAITEGRKVLSNVIYSQVLIHKNWGGVVPSLAKRAHEERIDFVVEECIRKYGKPIDTIDYLAVTQGPGLAIALEVGIRKTKELAERYDKKIIPVNHLEGHIYSAFVQNSRGNPKREFTFPCIALIVSGVSTEIVLMRDHLAYQVMGETIDDAAGEALDKAARMLGFGYPGGSVIERLAKESGNIDQFHFPRPMIKSNSLAFSFSGLKTSLYYFLKEISDKEKTRNLKEIASSYQEAVFETIVKKTAKALKQTGVNTLIAGGGVMANMRLRYLLRKIMRETEGTVVFPPYRYLNGDNAAMIGIVASYKAERNIYVTNIQDLDRMPRFPLSK